MILKTIAAIVVAALTFVSGTAFARATWTPPDDTIVGIHGTRHSGFQIRYYRQRPAYLPTISEAIAECAEYRDRERRFRCRVRTRTWYHDLGDTKRAIWYARDSAR